MKKLLLNYPIIISIVINVVYFMAMVSMIKVSDGKILANGIIYAMVLLMVILGIFTLKLLCAQIDFNKKIIICITYLINMGAIVKYSAVISMVKELLNK